MKVWIDQDLCTGDGRCEEFRARPRRDGCEGSPGSALGSLSPTAQSRQVILALRMQIARSALTTA